MGRSGSGWQVVNLSARDVYARNVDAIWRIDIVRDFDWVIARGAQAPKPKAKPTRIDERGLPMQVLMNGQGEEISHLRASIEASSYEEASPIVNANVVLWRDLNTRIRAPCDAFADSLAMRSRMRQPPTREII